MSVKTGEAHLASLRDGRELYLDGERVADVTTHRAYRNAARTAASLYDFQARPDQLEQATFDIGGGRRANRAWQMPASYDELRARRSAMAAWAETHYGFFGRSPDHVASCFAGMRMGIETFEAYDPARAKALAAYYDHARAQDLYLSYVIINPQADRSKSAGEQRDEDHSVRRVDEDSTGITVRGAKMLGTGTVLANEVLVTCIQPLKPGEEDYALSFCVPVATPGLRILSRRSYEAAARSSFDDPLSSRFDENDAVLFFDDVHVPWDRIFVAGDVRMCQAQFHATPAHVLQNYQCQVRLAVKLRFLLGLAHRIADCNGLLAMPAVRETLGQLAAEAAMVEAMIDSMEVRGRQQGAWFVPDRHALYAAQVLTQQLYPRINLTIRDLAGGGMIMLPSSVDDYANPLVAQIIRRTQLSSSLDADERVKLFKLAWDAVGSEFGSRHTQYEMFYAGASFVTKGHSFRTYDWAGASALAGEFLDSYSLDGAREQRGRSSAA